MESNSTLTTREQINIKELDEPPSLFMIKFLFIEFTKKEKVVKENLEINDFEVNKYIVLLITYLIFLFKNYTEIRTYI